MSAPHRIEAPPARERGRASAPAPTSVAVAASARRRSARVLRATRAVALAAALAHSVGPPATSAPFGPAGPMLATSSSLGPADSMPEGSTRPGSALAGSTVAGSALAGSAVAGSALARLVAAADNVVAGHVCARRPLAGAERGAAPGAGRAPGGAERVVVTVEGRSLVNGRAIEVDLVVAAKREPALLAPGADVVVAYAWTAAPAGGPEPGNALLPGGLFRLERAEGEPVVGGRGPGAAVERDQPLAALAERIRALRERSAPVGP